jgi:uncharacterized protein DUF6624
MIEDGLNLKLSEQLVRMAEEGRAIRAALSTEDSQFEYHPMMIALYRRSAELLNATFDSVGWPGRDAIGGASWAAMWLLHNAIGSPNVMRRGLGLLRAAERRWEVDPLHVALVEDRILMLEGRPQQYGTQVDWDDKGVLNPLPIADPGDVDVRRRAVGRGPLDEDIEQIRAEARSHGECAPADLASHKATAEAWARSVGWRD